MALFPANETNPTEIDEIYLCELHPNWNTAREWRIYLGAYHRERYWRRGNVISPPVGHYRRDIMRRWLVSHEYGSQISTSLPVRIAKDGMDTATQQYIVSVSQEIILKFRVPIMRQLYISVVPSARPRMQRAIQEYKNCRDIRVLRHKELHLSITGWVMAILNYTRNVYYPHLKRES